MTQEKIETITINDIEYVRKDSVNNELAKKTDGMEYCVIRTYSSGVFAGYVKSSEANDGHFVIELINSRRLHAWFGASLSQIAMEGFVDPSKCRVAMIEINKQLPNGIEIIRCTARAKKSIEDCATWKV